MNASFQHLLSQLPPLSKEVAEKLERSLDRTNSGYSIDLRTPLYGDKSREEIISSVEEAIGRTDISSLTIFDDKGKAKVGPASIMLPYNEQLEEVKAYEHQTFQPDYNAFESALSNVKGLLSVGSLRPLHFENVRDLLPRGTSSGLPMLTRVFDESWPTDLELAKNISTPEDVPPAIKYWRGQPNGLDKPPKQRVVSGMPRCEVIFGATLMYPILRALRKLPGFSAWNGPEFVDQEITDIIEDGGVIHSMDYAGFDSSLHGSFMRAAFDVMGSWFNSLGQDRLALEAEILLQTGLVVPYEVIWLSRVGGLLSGSIFTQVLGTICNLIAGNYIGIRADKPLRKYSVLGDDSVFKFQGIISAEEVADYVSELGLEANPDKQFIAEGEAHYLQRLHTRHLIINNVCKGIRSPFRALPMMLSYERFRSGWNAYMDIVRLVGQLEPCSNDPRFRKFVEWARNGDKFLRAGMDPVTAFRLAGGASKVNEVLGSTKYSINYRNTEGIAKFATTQILRSL